MPIHPERKATGPRPKGRCPHTTMSIQKRITKSGAVRWVTRWRDPAGREHSRSFDTRREARAHEDEKRRQLRRGNYMPDELDKITVGEIYDLWLDHRPLSKTSRDLYAHTRKKQLGWIADYPARQLTTADVIEWGDQLRTGRKWISAADTGLSESGARNIIRHLRTALKWGVENDMLAKNPVRVPPLSDEVEPDEIPTLREIVEVINAARAGGIPYMESKRHGQPKIECRQGPDHTLADMIYTASMTGMRISELCGLIVREVDLDAGVIKVRKQLGKDAPRQRVQLKTRASRRDIPIATELEDILRSRLHGRAAGEYVFTSMSGKPVLHSRAAVKMKRIAVHLGIDHMHFHALRHYFASSLITDGVPIQDVSQVLGHGGPAMTLKVYTHVVAGAQDRVRSSISSAIGCGIREGSRHLRSVG